MATSSSSELFTCDVQTPIGALQLIASRDALVGVRFPSHKPELPVHRAPATKLASRAHAVLKQAERELLEHFAAKRTRFTVPLAPQGTEFQRRVWRALQDIPFGQTRSYAQLAAAIGRPTASRAVGAANARNPLAIFIPCHRVIGAQGGLTGFAGGTEAKELLLELERGPIPARRAGDLRSPTGPSAAGSTRRSARPWL